MTKRTNQLADGGDMVSPVDVATKITLAGEISAANITAQTTSSAKFDWATEPGLTGQKVLEGLTGMGEALLTGVAVNYTRATADTQVIVSGDASLTADKTITLSADSTTRAATRTLDMAFFGSLQNWVNAGVVYAKNKSSANVDVQSGASISSNDLTVKASNHATTDISVYSIGTKTAAAFGAAWNDSDVNANANIANNVDLKVKNNLSLNATNTSSFNASSSVMAFGADAKVSGSFAYADVKTAAHATLGSNAGNSTAKIGNVSISALDQIDKIVFLLARQLVQGFLQISW